MYNINLRALFKKVLNPSSIVRFMAFAITLLTVSCEPSDEEVNIARANLTFSTDVQYIENNSMKVLGVKYNTDSMMIDYNRSKKTAKEAFEYVDRVAAIKKYINSAIESKKATEKAKTAALVAKNFEKWKKTKAGKLHAKHPDWSVEECNDVADHRYWIGMSLDMLKASRGNPNSANPSNYGNGVQWQWCWDDYTPSCFYGGADGIITSYN